MATPWYKAIEEMVELFDGVAPVGRQRIKRKYATAYRRVLRRYYFPELLTDWVSFTWESGRSYDPIAEGTITDWWGRPCVMRGNSDEPNWRRLDDEIELADLQGTYDGSGSSNPERYTHRDGRRLYAISGRGQKIQLVAALSGETVSLRHFADPGELTRESDELVIEDDYEVFKAKAAADIWRSLPGAGLKALPEPLSVMDKAADEKLALMVSDMNEMYGVELEILPDELMTAAARHQAYRDGMG